MAIYSCSHSSVGRSTHAAGTAGAHADYVTRESAARAVAGEHMPCGRGSARSWLDGQEAADRKNARVIDKVMLALPLELDEAQRVQLVRDFAQAVGKGRIPWMAGIHDRGKDRGNPHAHVIFRDRDHETGKRVAGLSEKGSTERLRETWEQVCNQALNQAGHDARIDRRSLAAQGKAAQPGIHVGPNVLAMEERGIRPRSRPQVTVSGRVIDWPKIDRGRTRLDRLAELEAANENEGRERGGKEKGQGGAPAAPAGDGQPSRPAPSPAEEPCQAPQDVPTAPPSAEAATVPPPSPSEAPQCPAQEQRAASRPRDVSRLRQALDRARTRLDALSNRLEQAFARIKERFNHQDRTAPAASPRKSLDAYRRTTAPRVQPVPPEPSLRKTLNAYKRTSAPGREGPER